MSNPNLTTASGAIGLAKSLIDFVPASGTLINVSRETYDWLIRERIDEGSFETCRRMALGLAYPNDAGMDIQRQIKEADQKLVERIKQLPIRLVLSGSIGRLLAKNVDTCYMVSTVAVLTKFHHPQFATDALCSMILDKGGHEKNVSFQYNVQRSPVKAVISKLVESIYVNVVNAGHDLGGLPAELKHLHPHLLDDRTFAGIVMGIERSEQDVVIRSDRLLSDLTLWLLLHFQGCIVVSVDKTVLFEKTLGPDLRVVRVMVKETCPEATSIEDAYSCIKPDRPVEAFMSVGDKLFTFLKGRETGDVYRTSYTRRALYDIEYLPGSLPSRTLRDLNQEECNSIANVAATIMNWLLNVPIISARTNQGLAFRVLLREGEGSGLSIGDLLQNHPRLYSLETDFSPKPEPVSPRLDGDGSADNSPKSVYSIFQCFPMAQCLLDRVQARCSCVSCNFEAKLDFFGGGCFRKATATQLFVLLAHGICDAFGAKDVSGRASSEDQVTATAKLLSAVLYWGEVRWDTWFELVACTVTGIPLDTLRTQSLDSWPGSSNWAAIQYGSLLAVAPWLDIAKKAKVKGCFGIITVEGNLLGVADDTGLVRCEMDGEDGRIVRLRTPGNCEYECNRTQNEAAGEDPNDNAFEVAIQLDTLKAEFYTAIFHISGCFYQLMTTVRSDTNVRIVNPGRVITGLAHSASIQCKHDPASAMNSSTKVEHVDDFGRILATWSSFRPELADTIRVSKVLDSQLKINVALGICGKVSVLRDTNTCCFSCAIEKLHGLEDGYQRFVINTTAHSTAFGQSRALKGRTEL